MTVYRRGSWLEPRQDLGGDECGSTVDVVTDRPGTHQRQQVVAELLIDRLECKVRLGER
jgi:hypothetical protein